MVYDRVGEELARTSYSWKTLKNLGATISNGSDCPVELPDVLAGTQCAVTRRDLKGSVPAYLPAEAFTVQEALDSFTCGGAYASFEEQRKGKIQPGMAADFVILDTDPFLVRPSDICRISVTQTFLAGNCVYQKS
jgi:predicted amidohydrolase YtcJ